MFYLCIKKKCRKCLKFKSIGLFNREKKGEYKRHSHCKECRKSVSQKLRAKNRANRTSVKEKVCTKCKINKKIIEFSRNNNSIDGHGGACKKCHKQYREEVKRRKKIISQNKKCAKCHITKPEQDFNKNINSKDGLNFYCKKCLKIERKKYKERIQKRKISRKSKECSRCKKIKLKNEFAKSSYSIDGMSWNCKKCINEYARSNKEATNTRDRKRISTDIKYKLNKRLSCSIRFSLKNGKEGKHWEDLVGYTVNNLKDHLESLFEPWMNWENYGVYKIGGPKTWQIDHIVPKSWFKYTSYEDEEFKKCWALSNLQPKCSKENHKKRNYFIG